MYQLTLLKFILFADDTNILYSDSNVHNLISIINHELDKLYTWFSVNTLSLNASKTNYMVFGRRKINCDVDNVSTKLLKQTVKEVATPLAHIVNLSLSHGIFPNDMKLAKIVPIFKNGNTKLFNNYRPISILPAFSKILEKIVCNRLLHFLESKNIPYKHQYGFMKNHNTIHPVIHLLKDIANANDN